MQRLKLAQIRTDGGTQTRDGVNLDAAQDYADALQNEAAFPPVIVFYDGSEYWLADGFHRYEAHKRLDWLEIDAEVKQGTQRDAILYSVGANSSHGLRRTNADKRRAVEVLLRDDEWSGWSDRKIAEACGVGNQLVGHTRAAICVNHTDKPSKRKVERNGTTYTQNTAKIGKRPAPAPAMPDPIWPAHDPETGEIVQATPQFDLPETIPNEVWQAAQATVPITTPHTRLDDALRASGHSGRADDLSRALSRVLEFEREAAGILGTPYAQQAGIYRLARELRDLLGEWLEGEPTNARGQHVITLDAN